MIIDNIYVSSEELELVQDYLDKHDELWISAEQIAVTLIYFEFEINNANLETVVIEDGSVSIQDHTLTFLNNDIVEERRNIFYDGCIDEEKSNSSDLIRESLNEGQLLNNVYQYYSFEEESSTDVINFYIDEEFESEYYVEIE